MQSAPVKHGMTDISPLVICILRWLDLYRQFAVTALCILSVPIPPSISVQRNSGADRSNLAVGQPRARPAERIK